MAFSFAIIMLVLALLALGISLILVIAANVAPRRTPEWKKKVTRVGLYMLVGSGIGLVLSFTFCSIGFNMESRRQWEVPVMDSSAADTTQVDTAKTDTQNHITNP